MNIELDDFKELANSYYKKLTEKRPEKGIGSIEHIYFGYGIEWAYNRLSSTKGKEERQPVDMEWFVNNLLSYKQMRDAWKEHTRNWEVYDLMVREYIKIIEKLESSTPPTEQGEESTGIEQGKSIEQGARVITIRWIDKNRYVANNLDGDLLFTGTSPQEVEDWAVDHNYDIQEHRPVRRKATKRLNRTPNPPASNTTGADSDK